MSKIIFLTFNDYPGGIFSGQVVDVCKFLNEQGADVELLSFISLRTFFKTTSQIKSEYEQASTLYMSPGVRNWKKNVNRLMKRVAKANPDIIIARGPFAAWLALECRDAGLVKRVVFDGRGAYEAEFKEYNVARSELLNTEIRSIEATAVSKSDFRIAVSEALVNYWRKEFAYDGAQHVVIPCTLRKTNASTRSRETMRNELGYRANDIVIVYSGSSAGWQSLDMLDEMGGKLLAENPAIRILVLAPDPGDLKIALRYPERVAYKWLAGDKVSDVLSACDYGWLVREDSVTNRVASPVKFAEYLHAGLSVLISPDLGDFSEFAVKHGCGIVLSDKLPVLSQLSAVNREHSKQLAAKYFIKSNYAEQYKLAAR